MSNSNGYRVRDKNYPGKPGHVWGEGLTYDEAEQLKNKIANSRQSSTVRVESMDQPGDVTAAPQAQPPKSSTRPSNAMRRRQVVQPGQAPAPVPEHLRGEKQTDPVLERNRQRALGAVSGTAAEAQRRADAYQKRQQLQADIAKTQGEIDAMSNNLPLDFVNDDPPGVPSLDDELGIDPEAS